ncbi:MAG: lipoprotein LpqV [Mycobacteriaceae bacterium]
MLSTRHRALFGATAISAAAATLLTGCSAGGGSTASKAPSAAPSASATAPQAPPGDAPIGVSAGGVTTRIDEPAQSTEEQYGQSCLGAKDWMSAKGGDPHDLVEPLLQEVQSAKDPSQVTFKKTWAELSSPQQAAVIIAVRAAADGGC